MRFVDAQGLAAFMSLGFVQQGFELTMRTGDLDFGAPQAEANRHLLGQQWESLFTTGVDSWPTPSGHVEVVAGLPPCSAWSVFTGGLARSHGADAPALKHTWDLVTYAGRVKPDVVVYESVQQAFTKGRDVLQTMRAHLEEESGKKYDLHHVKMNVLQVGGKAYRPRYFWVALRSGLPFTTAVEWPESIPNIMQTIGDLSDLDNQWEAQPYRLDAHPSAQSQRSASGMVDGHIRLADANSRRVDEIFSVLASQGLDWEPGDALSVVLKKMYERDGKLPSMWEKQQEKIVSRNFYMGFTIPYRWRADAWANVVVGRGLELTVHPTESRLITHREAARIQGLPDDWLIEPNQKYSALRETWGKAVSVNAGDWIAKQVKNTLEGTLEGDSGQLIGDREWVHETDRGFSREAARKRYFPGTRGGTLKITRDARES